jgi:hypothetical protein
MCQALAVAGRPLHPDPGAPVEGLEFALLVRVREVVDGSPATEVELRKLSEETDAWARTLEAQLEASEARLQALVADPVAPIAALAEELRRIEKLRPELVAVRAQVVALEGRARELRTIWLTGQTTSESWTAGGAS